MASMTRRIRRMMDRTSKVVPMFTEKELSKIPEEKRQELAKAIAEVEPDHPLAAKSEPATEPVVETTAAPVSMKSDEPVEVVSDCPIYDGVSKGTIWTAKSEKHGGPFGPFKNQDEAKSMIKLHLGVDRMPPGTFSRV